MSHKMTRRSAGRMGSAAGAGLLLALTALAGCGGGGGGGLPQATPTPMPTATPFPNPTPVILTTFSVSGNFDAATGKFTQKSGTYQRVQGTMPAGPAPDATPTPVPQPVPPGPTISVYSGTFQLKSGVESGEFNLVVLPDNSADGVGISPDVFRFVQEPVTVGHGRATITLQVNGSTGTGTIMLSNGVTGTITITSRSAVGASSRARLLRGLSK